MLAAITRQTPRGQTDINKFISKCFMFYVLCHDKILNWIRISNGIRTSQSDKNCTIAMSAQDENLVKLINVKDLS